MDAGKGDAFVEHTPAAAAAQPHLSEREVELVKEGYRAFEPGDLQ